MQSNEKTLPNRTNLELTTFRSIILECNVSVSKNEGINLTRNLKLPNNMKLTWNKLDDFEALYRMRKSTFKSKHCWLRPKESRFISEVTILLSQTVFSLLVANHITKTSEAIPLLGRKKLELTHKIRAQMQI